jgi:hypothetical protein
MARQAYWHHAFDEWYIAITILISGVRAPIPTTDPAPRGSATTKRKQGCLPTDPTVQANCYIDPGSLWLGGER